MRLVHAIVYVRDMSRSIRFYRDFLGVELRFESPHWSEFETEGAVLALHLAEGTGDTTDGTAAGPGTCRPGLSVPDLDALHHRVLAQGVRCVHEPAETFGVRLARYLDPDGLTLTVSERPRRGTDET